MADLDRFPPWQGDQPSRDNLARVDDELWERHTLARARIRDEHGITITVVSAWRDTAKQRQLWDCYQARLRTGKCPCGSCNLAAVPGTSNHERGLALDLAPGPRSIPAARAIYYELGIIFPVISEDWHAELDPARKPIPRHAPPPPVQEVSTMHIVANADGRLEEFDLLWTRVIHRWQLTPNGAWSDWHTFPPLPGGEWAADLGVGRNEDGRLEVVVKTGGNLRFRSWQDGAGNPFTPWVAA